MKKCNPSKDLSYDRMEYEIEFIQLNPTQDDDDDDETNTYPSNQQGSVHENSANVKDQEKIPKTIIQKTTMTYSKLTTQKHSSPKLGHQKISWHYYLQ